jgi:DNA-binding HxlR family transcriptional regulator
MSAPVRYDQQYCPIARALDVLGDRWTLPILRELVIGDQRFSDLRSHLPGIAPTVLTQRLHTMCEQGLVTTRKVDAASRRSLYTLTDRGREAVPILTALAKWGMPLLEEPSDDRKVRPFTAVNTGVAIYYDPIAAGDVDERYRFVVDGQQVVLSSVRGGGEQRDEADVEFESGTAVWIAMRQGHLTLRQAEERGLVKVKGKRASVRNFQRIFHVA